MATILKQAIMAAHNHGFLPVRAVSLLIRLFGLAGC